MVTYIQCKNCGKTIEKKWKREVCIPCANKRDREVARAYRERKAKEQG